MVTFRLLSTDNESTISHSQKTFQPLAGLHHLKWKTTLKKSPAQFNLLCFSPYQAKARRKNSQDEATVFIWEQIKLNVKMNVSVMVANSIHSASSKNYK